MDSAKHAAAAAAPLQRPGPSHINEIPALFHEMLESIQHYSTQASQVIYRELEALSRFIADANAEIVAIRPKDICDLHLPGAADELDAVVGHTEQATNTIFAAVEAIEGVLGEMPPETAAKVTDAVTQIYEACSFQDITGQRIGKVLRALQEVQNRVGSLLVAFGDDSDAPRKADAGNPEHLTGPQLPTRASSQADIDALLGGSPAASGGQSDIDAMFDSPAPAATAGQGDIDAMFDSPAPARPAVVAAAPARPAVVAAAPAAARPAGGTVMHRLDGAVELHGPQLPKHAPNQDDIDALLKSLG